MVRLELLTTIAAPIERVFDLARSIDLHMASTNWTGERAISGVTSGLIGPGQDVTWKGRHFGVAITHTSRITEYEFPNHFRDCMVQGWFRRFCHDHYFQRNCDTTAMKDVMAFEGPWGHVGVVVERLVLKRHMEDLLIRRNQCIQRVAESEGWRRFLRM